MTQYGTQLAAALAMKKWRLPFAMAISPLVLYMAFSLGSFPMLFVGAGVVQLIFFFFQWCHNSAKRGLHGT